MDYITTEQQSDWADALLSGVSDTSTSNSSVVNWLQGNLGVLNAHLSTSFALVESGYISPGMNDIQSGIYNELFICSWLRKKAINVLGTMEYDWTTMEGKDQGRISRVSHTQKATTYQSMAKDCDVQIKDLIKTYRGGDFARPRQITFNNRFSAPLDIDCLRFNWSYMNPITNYL